MRKPGSLRRVVGALLAAGHLSGGCAARAQRPSSGFVDGPDSVRLYFETAGTGPQTAVVVHGGPGAGIGDIRPDLEPLEAGHRVVYYDQRGGGRSTLPEDPSQLDARAFVADLEAVRRHFGLERLNLVAHSFGAVLAAEYARTHPHRVARLVFLAATGPRRAQAAEFYAAQPRAADAEAARVRQEALESLLEGTAADPIAACRAYEAAGRRLAAAAGEFAGWRGTSCDMPAEAVRYYYRVTAQLGPRAFGAWDYTRSLADLEAPLLIVHGERDAAGLAMDLAWAAALPDARLLVVADAGRTAYAERPAAVFPAIATFLAGDWPAGAEPVGVRAPGRRDASGPESMP